MDAHAGSQDLWNVASTCAGQALETVRLGTRGGARCSPTAGPSGARCTRPGARTNRNGTEVAASAAVIHCVGVQSVRLGISIEGVNFSERMRWPLLLSLIPTLSLFSSCNVPQCVLFDHRMLVLKSTRHPAENVPSPRADEYLQPCSSIRTQGGSLCCMRFVRDICRSAEAGTQALSGVGPCLLPCADLPVLCRLTRTRVSITSGGLCRNWSYCVPAAGTRIVPSCPQARKYRPSICCLSPAQV
jgi:hypothetical protein